MKRIWMNRTMTALALCAGLMVVGGYSGAAEKPAAAKKPAGGAESFILDPKASSLRWTGRKVTGSHNGTVDFEGGRVEIAKGAITGGEFTINMGSIQDLDITNPESNAKLVNHLKSEDFFGVEKHPTALFKIVEAKPIAGAEKGKPNYQVKGQLTVKGQTHPAEFPATITIEGGVAKASAADVKVDRTLYDIRYGSGKFFQNLGNKMIDDHFTIDFDVTAKK